MTRGALQARKREVVREALRLAAEDLIARHGYDRVTVEHIANAAGVSRRTFFRYFETKEDVVVAGSDRFADDLVAAVAGRPAHEPPLVAIRNALVPVLEQALAKADLVRGVIAILRGNTPLRRAMLERRSRMEERLAAALGRRLGQDPQRASAPVLLAYLTRAVSDTAFNVWYDQRRGDVAGLVDELFAELRALATARPRRARR